VQTRRGSLIEACFGTAIGLVVSTVANIVLMPMYGYPITLGESASLSVIYTIISVTRSFLVRRVFEGVRGL
jgi:hypothetical protein